MNTITRFVGKDCDAIYDDYEGTLKVSFNIENYRHDVEAQFADNLVVCHVPAKAKRDAGQHTWQIAAQFNKPEDHGRNRRIGYVPEEVAELLDTHLNNLDKYKENGSWARWKCEKEASGTDAGKLWCKASVTLYAQNHGRLADEVIDKVFDTFDKVPMPINIYPPMPKIKPLPINAPLV